MLKQSISRPRLREGSRLVRVSRAERVAAARQHPAVRAAWLNALLERCEVVAMEAGTVSEAAFQSLLIDLAEATGWLVFHDRDSRGSRPGLPDLVLVKPPYLYFMELKAERGTLTPEQREWLMALRQCSVLKAGVFRPRQAREIAQFLLRPEQPQEARRLPNEDNG